MHKHSYVIRGLLAHMSGEPEICSFYVELDAFASGDPRMALQVAGVGMRAEANRIFFLEKHAVFVDMRKCLTESACHAML